MKLECALTQQTLDLSMNHAHIACRKFKKFLKLLQYFILYRGLNVARLDYKSTGSCHTSMLNKFGATLCRPIESHIQYRVQLFTWK